MKQDRWIEERDELARELRRSMGDEAIRGELRDRWNIEAGPDEGDPALMLANVRLGDEVRTEGTTPGPGRGAGAGTDGMRR